MSCHEKIIETNIWTFFPVLALTGGFSCLVLSQTKLVSRSVKWRKKTESGREETSVYLGGESFAINRRWCGVERTENGENCTDIFKEGKLRKLDNWNMEAIFAAYVTFRNFEVKHNP